MGQILSLGKRRSNAPWSVQWFEDIAIPSKDYLYEQLVNACFDVQEGVAIETAEAIVGALKGELVPTAINAPMVPAEVSLS